MHNNYLNKTNNSIKSHLDSSSTYFFNLFKLQTIDFRDIFLVILNKNVIQTQHRHHRNQHEIYLWTFNWLLKILVRKTKNSIQNYRTCNAHLAVIIYLTLNTYWKPIRPTYRRVRDSFLCQVNLSKYKDFIFQKQTAETFL